MDLWHKDPADQNIWYEFDWSANDSGGNPWLPPGVTITSYAATTDGQTTLVADQLGPASSSGLPNASVFVQLTGGTAGAQSVITCEITASDGSTYSTTKNVFISTRIS